MKLTGITESCAEHIRTAIRNQPDRRWQRSGKLLASVRGEGNQVVTTADRLNDDEVAQRFADECVKDPTDDRRFVSELDKAITEMLDRQMGDG